MDFFREQVVLRRKKTPTRQNLNLINNNDSGNAGTPPGSGFSQSAEAGNSCFSTQSADRESQPVTAAAKRRSYHPQDYLSKVLDQPENGGSGTSGSRARRRRPVDFPKVKSLPPIS